LEIRRIAPLLSVGKTSLLHAFTEDKFTQAYKATVGADFVEQSVFVDGKEVVLEVRVSSFRFGTLRDKSDLKVWALHSIEGRIAVFWSMTSPVQR